ncbi:MAG: ABC transporter ATP-binding protein [Bacilli bacterium]
MENQSLLQVTDLVVRFKLPSTGFRREFIRPVNRVTFAVKQREIMGVVGESGSGKTTLGQTIARMLAPNSGQIVLDGRNVTSLNRRELTRYWGEVQMMFQDVYASFNPVYNIEQQLSFVIRRYQSRHKRGLEEELTRLLGIAGLTPADEFRRKMPHELSGGQRQRVALVRALAVQPKLLVADEPVSMLDVSLRAGVLNLMLNLRNEFGMSYLFITHDLSSAQAVCDRILVMYGGRIVEMGKTDDLLNRPLHPYTRRLIEAATFDVEMGTPAVGGDGGQTAAELLESYIGCPFRRQCPIAEEVCSRVDPKLVQESGTHAVACHAMDTTSVADREGGDAVTQ